MQLNAEKLFILTTQNSSSLGLLCFNTSVIQFTIAFKEEWKILNLEGTPNPHANLMAIIAPILKYCI